MGTASQAPTRYRNHNGYFLRWDGEGILFDPGEGTQRQFTLAGVSAADVTRICINRGPPVGHRPATARTNAPAATDTDGVVHAHANVVLFRDAHNTLTARGLLDGAPRGTATAPGRILFGDETGATLWQTRSNERRVVRVSEHNPWWVPCDQLQPLANACQAVAAKPKTRGLKLPPQSESPPADAALSGPDGRGIPSCPGDPRCPSGN